MASAGVYRFQGGLENRVQIMSELLSALHGMPSLLCGYPTVPAALDGCCTLEQLSKAFMPETSNHVATVT